MIGISQGSSQYSRFLDYGVTGFEKVAQLTRKPENYKPEAIEEVSNLVESIRVASGIAVDSIVSSQNVPENTASDSEAFLERQRAHAALLESTNNFLASYGLPPARTHGEAINDMSLVIRDMPPYSQPLEVTTDTGLHVKVGYGWIYPEGTGNEKTLGAKVTLSRDGQELQSFPLNKDVRITELTSGEFEIVTLGEGETVLQGTESNDILISQFAQQVFGRGGDDTIFSLGSGEYHGDAGNDTFFALGERYNHEKGTGGVGSIFGGDGDDVVTSESIVGAKIDLGEGNNILTASQIRYSDLQAASGNNVVAVGYMDSSTIRLGDGANTVFLKTVSSSNFSVGHGDNNIYISMMLGNGTSRVSTGDGNNRVQIDWANWTENFKAHDISFGSGRNEISSLMMGGGAKVTGNHELIDNDDRFLKEITGLFQRAKSNMPDTLQQHLNSA